MNFEQTDKFNDNDQAKATRSWLLSFIDLLSLVLAFFVLLYSTKDIPQEKYDEIKNSFTKYVYGIDNNKKQESQLQSGKTNIIKKAANISYIQTLFRNSLLDTSMPDIKFTPQENQLNINFEEDFTDQKKFSDELTKKLLPLAKTINTLSNQVEIVVENTDIDTAMQITDIVSAKIEELGYEHNILRTLPFDTENVEKNKNKPKIDIIIKNYEAVF